MQKFADEANGNNVDAKYDVDGHANSNDDNSNDTKANNDENASKNDHDGNDAIDDNANDDDEANVWMLKLDSKRCHYFWEVYQQSSEPSKMVGLQLR